MAGYPGGDFYSSPGLGGGSAINNSFHVQYRPQLGGGILVDPTAIVSQRADSATAKRSLAELQQQQQALFLRSVKQRNHQTSPISPLSPVSPEISSASSASSARNHGFTLLSRPNLLSAPNVAFSGINLRQGHEAEPDSAHKMRNRLQELERQLLNDDDNHEEGDCSAASTMTYSEWSETMQSLVTPPPPQKPLSPSPTTSSASSSNSSSSCSTNTTTSPAKQQLLDAASAISEGNTESATAILTRLQQVSSSRSVGNPEQRLIAYLVQALMLRINPSDTCFDPVAELCSKEHVMATQMLFEASPCFKLGFMAANHTILEATQNQAKIHVVDFDIGQGSQYMTLIHALGERQSAKPAVKITAVNDPNASFPDALRIVGDRLTKLAERVGVSLRFGVVCRKLSDLNRETLGCEQDETLAVNFAFRLHKMPDESVSTANPRDELLRLVKGLGPRVVTLVEQEMNANTAPFLARFNETQSYYGALFESLDATMARETKERTLVEECVARKATNCVAREGRDRVERCEVFGKWRARMGMAGFEARPLSAQLNESMRVRVNSIRPNPGFFVKEDSGGVCFGWKGRVLAVASAWR
ncbi:scarecrow-like protein 8 [Aristolochia californica]|uniref:scarecrow-like protein 8 n=1 Tax=Aristolochia californica TaxID=171875 RepID=UPI0035E2124D